MRRISLLIVEDHPIFRDALRETLEGDFEVLGVAAEGGEGMEKAFALKPDVVLMDIEMPGMSGLAAARQITSALPNTKVVILSASADEESVLEAVEAGVSGYLNKAEQASAVRLAIELAADGKAYLPPAITKRLMSGIAAQGRGEAASGASSAALSPRETAVLKLLATGHRNIDIAHALFISQRTVGNHVSSIYNKIGVSDRTQATAFAIKHGIVRV